MEIPLQNENINSRISEIRDHFCDKNNKKFAEMLGISTSRASNLCNSEPSIGTNIKERILKAFPEVSRAWLYFGDGDMLIHPGSASPSFSDRRNDEGTTKERRNENADQPNGQHVTNEAAVMAQINSSGNNDTNSIGSSDPVIAVLLDRIKDKDDTIGTLRETITTLRGEVEQLRSYVSLTSSKYINIVERMLYTTTETNDLIKAGYSKIGFRLDEREDGK